MAWREEHASRWGGGGACSQVAEGHKAQQVAKYQIGRRQGELEGDMYGEEFSPVSGNVVFLRRLTRFSSDAALCARSEFVLKRRRR